MASSSGGASCRPPAHARRSGCYGDRKAKRRGGQRIAAQHVAGTEAPRQRAARGAELRQWLGNPLIVAVVSTLLVSLVIPRLTTQWQDHQKELEIQTSLVGSMSSSASSAVMAGRMLVSGLYSGREWQQVYNDAIRTWSVDGSTAGARLQAYFPGSGIGDDWGKYVAAVGDYVQLAGPSSTRAIQVEQIREVLPNLRLDWRTIVAARPVASFQRAYTVLGYALLGRRDELVRDVLEDHPSGF